MTCRNVKRCGSPRGGVGCRRGGAIAVSDAYRHKSVGFPHPWVFSSHPYWTPSEKGLRVRTQSRTVLSRPGRQHRGRNRERTEQSAATLSSLPPRPATRTAQEHRPTADDRISYPFRTGSYYSPSSSCSLDGICRIYGMGWAILLIPLILSEFPFGCGSERQALRCDHCAILRFNCSFCDEWSGVRHG